MWKIVEASGMNHGPTRLSFGGSVVEKSLVAAGYRPRVGVELIESYRHFAGTRILLAQNAWNFIPRVQYLSEARGVPLLRLPAHAARRTISRRNARRAGEVVALTPYMATLLSELNSHVSLVSVTLPIDDEFLAALSDLNGVREEPQLALIPGTVAPYKRTLEAILEAHRSRGVTDVILAGRSSNEGYLRKCFRQAERFGLTISQQPVDRTEMVRLLAGAGTIIVGSALESLSISASEALVLGRRVILSDIPVHRHLLTELGVQADRQGKYLHCEPKPMNVDKAIAEGKQRWRDVVRVLDTSDSRRGA